MSPVVEVYVCPGFLGGIKTIALVSLLKSVLLLTGRKTPDE